MQHKIRTGRAVASLDAQSLFCWVTYGRVEGHEPLGNHRPKRVDAGPEEGSGEYRLQLGRHRRFPRAGYPVQENNLSCDHRVSLRQRLCAVKPTNTEDSTNRAGVASDRRAPLGGASPNVSKRNGGATVPPHPHRRLRIHSSASRRQPRRLADGSSVLFDVLEWPSGCPVNRRTDNARLAVHDRPDLGDAHRTEPQVLRQTDHMGSSVVATARRARDVGVRGCVVAHPKMMPALPAKSGGTSDRRKAHLAPNAGLVTRFAASHPGRYRVDWPGWAA